MTRLMRAEVLNALSRDVVRMTAAALGALLIATVAAVYFAGGPSGQAPANPGLGQAILGGVVAYMVGAGLIGGQWRFGVIRNQLVWHPNRVQLALVKILVSAAIGGAMGLLVNSLWIVVLVQSGRFAQLGQVFVYLLLAGWAGGMGASIALAGHSSSAALVVLLALPFAEGLLNPEASPFFPVGGFIALSLSGINRASLGSALALAATLLITAVVATGLFRRGDVA